MIRGLIALLTSGILLNPMVILGIIGGIAMMHTLPENSILALFQNTKFYTVLFGVAFLFAFFFEKVYLSGGKKINWKATVGIAFSRFATLLATIVLTCLFVYSFSFEDLDTLQKDQTAKETMTAPIQTNDIIFK